VGEGALGAGVVCGLAGCGLPTANSVPGSGRWQPNGAGSAIGRRTSCWREKATTALFGDFGRFAPQNRNILHALDADRPDSKATLP